MTAIIPMGRKVNDVKSFILKQNEAPAVNKSLGYNMIDMTSILIITFFKYLHLRIMKVHEDKTSLFSRGSINQ